MKYSCILQMYIIEKSEASKKFQNWQSPTQVEQNVLSNKIQTIPKCGIKLVQILNLNFWNTQIQSFIWIQEEVWLSELNPDLQDQNDLDSDLMKSNQDNPVRSFLEYWSLVLPSLLIRTSSQRPLCNTIQSILSVRYYNYKI